LYCTIQDKTAANVSLIEYPQNLNEDGGWSLSQCGDDVMNELMWWRKWKKGCYYRWKSLLCWELLKTLSSIF